MTATSLLDTIPLRHKNEPCCSPVAAPSMSETRTVALAAQLKAVADPTRLRMLDLLVQQSEPLCVCDLTGQFVQNQPTISHHLRILREAGLIDTEKRGIWSYYWVTDAGTSTLSALGALS